MKKEKKIRTYQRRTKSGKTITVRAHTASYEASEKNKEVTKKKGAGDELKRKKSSAPDKVATASSFMDNCKNLDALREYASQVMDSTAPYKAKTRKELKRMFDADQGKTGSHEKKFKKFLESEWLPNKDNVQGNRRFYLGSNTHKVYKAPKTPSQLYKQVDHKLTTRVDKGDKRTKKLTSAQAHAINALLDKPGWNMKNAEAYVRTLSPKEVDRLRWSHDS